MQIASWNVNSIRAREERALAWLAKAAPDVVCLQELKVVDDAFPHEAMTAAGYHAVVHGQPTYNGVGILSRSEPTEVRRGLEDGVDDPQARLIAATVEGVRVVCVYVPNGGEVGSDKWTYKLEWLGRLRAWLERHARSDQPLIVAGDYNVAPDDRDAANPEQWAETVLCHPEARAAYGRLLDWGLTDAQRLHDDAGGTYSWWDYRRLAFPKNDGLRIDLLLVTEPLAARCRRVWVDRDERKGKKPSDHAPVLGEFD